MQLFFFPAGNQYDSTILHHQQTFFAWSGIPGLIAFNHSPALGSDVDLRILNFFSDKRWRSCFMTSWRHLMTTIATVYIMGKITFWRFSFQFIAQVSLWVKMIFNYGFFFSVIFLPGIMIILTKRIINWTKAFRNLVGFNTSASSFLFTSGTPWIGFRNRWNIMCLISKHWIQNFSCVAAFIWSRHFRMSFEFIPVLWVSLTAPFTDVYSLSHTPSTSKESTHHSSNCKVPYT